MVIDIKGNSIKVKFNDEWFIAYLDADSLSRATVIDLGGKLIATAGNITDEFRPQLWMVKSADEVVYWLGDDWYSNVDARLRRCYKSPF